LIKIISIYYIFFRYPLAVDYKKIFNKHLKNLHKYPELEFFFKTQTRYLILLLACVDYESENKLIKNFKYYYNNIPSKISSQININNQIDLAIESGYLIKKKSIFDKRATIITVKKNIKETLDKYLKEMIE